MVPSRPRVLNRQAFLTLQLGLFGLWLLLSPTCQAQTGTNDRCPHPLTNPVGKAPDRLIHREAGIALYGSVHTSGLGHQCPDQGHCLEA